MVNQAGSQPSQSMRYDSSAPTSELSLLVNVDPSSNGHSVNGSSTELLSDTSIDELDNIRLREITSKAVSGTLLLLVKWFKRSREF